MALFTDGIISTLEELAGQDSSILEICSAEGIDLTRKVELAQTEIGIELEAALRRVYGGSGAEGGGGSQRVANVVVTPPLKLWHTFRTLELAYRDAYHNQLNDRYRGRRDEYRDLARWAAEKLLQTGIGISENATPRAGQVTLQANFGVMLGGTYYFAMCWVGASGEEGTPSDVQAFELASLGGVTVRAGTAPARAAGWNVYVGTSESNVRLQNPAVLGVAEAWVQATAPLTDSRGPGSGPEATAYVQAPRVIQRG
jgi:hypothetical protein